MPEDYGSPGNIRFMSPDQVKIVDKEGNEMLCKCGKPASGGMMGKTAFMLWCIECGPSLKYMTELCYKPDNFQKCDDKWIVDL